MTLFPVFPRIKYNHLTKDPHWSTNGNETDYKGFPVQVSDHSLNPYYSIGGINSSHLTSKSYYNILLKKKVNNLRHRMVYSEEI